MPNWCMNSMMLVGPADQVKSVVDSVRPVDGESPELGLTKFMPQSRDESGELVGGVDWQYENWGTKWGDCDTDIAHEEYEGGNGSASITYNTAWGPMSKLVAEISRQHPELTIDIEYDEPGMCFFGIERFRAGNVVHENHHEWNPGDGKITLPDGWEANFDTDWDNPDQDPSGTQNDATMSAIEHMWTQLSLAGTSAPSDSGATDS